MPAKIAVCDDVSADRQTLIKIIKSKDPFCQYTIYNTAEELLWDFENDVHFDIVFLDIFMNGMTGIEAARHIRQIDSHVIIIFISNSNDFYRDSFDLYAFNYLLKPISEEKLIDVYFRALTQIGKEIEQCLHISFNNILHTIRYSQLLYLSSNQHIVYFYLKSGEQFKTYGKLDDIMKQLPANEFIRCHKSYIVNLIHVTSMTSKEFIIEEIKIPISRNFSKGTREKYHALMFGDF